MPERFIKLPIDKIIEDVEFDNLLEEMIKLEKEKPFVKRMPIILNLHTLKEATEFLRNYKFARW